MQKFIVEFGYDHRPLSGPPEKFTAIEGVDAEHRVDALMVVLTRSVHPLIARIRAFPAHQDEKGAWVKDEQTCGNCGWLHENSPQFTSGLYDRDKGQPWCWAVPSHVHRSAKLPACAHWKPKEEGT